MIALLLAATLQQAAPTVGDTVWVERAVPISAGWVAESRPWRPEGGEVDALGPPEVRSGRGRVTLRYPAVFWVPGAVAVALPSVLLTGPRGAVDSLPVATVVVRIASVLPPDAPDSSIAPQPAAGMVPVHRRRVWPALAGLALAVAASTLAWRWWTARGAVPAPAGTPPPTGAPVAQWAAAGEVRAVAGAAAAELRTAIARQVPAAHTGLDTEACLRRLDETRPGWPLAELGRLLRELDLVRFGSDSTARDVLPLHAQAMALAARLDSPPAGAP